MRRLLFFFFFISALLLGFYFNHLSRYRDVFRSICDLTEEHFYREDMRLKQWLRLCHQHAARISVFSSVDQLLSAVQSVMNEMPVSHFQIYSPDEDKRMWKGEGIDSGVRARYVEDHLVIYRVLAESGGALAGLRAGDDILHIEGAEQLTPWGAAHRSGHFRVRRAGHELTVDVHARSIVEDMAPHIRRLNASTALVELPSFRSEFFDREAWRRFAAQFKDYSHLIVDVRENSGGNFVAMLRALSTFQCAGKNIGMLLQPRKELEDRPGFEDNTSDDYQIEELDKYRSLGMITFADYGCYQGRVTVLAGPETSSVAEIFTNSFRWRKNSRIWGQPTAGDVVLAVWYDLPALGPGYSVSIPEAVYLTPQKKELEGSGVWPQRELYHDLATALRGQDSWVIEALK
jgi:C-terminal processing protease CtpA/Prc